MNAEIIRLAEGQDMERVGEILVEGFMDKFSPLFGGRVDRAPALMARLLGRQLAGGKITIFVAEAEGEVVGTIGMKLGGGPSFEWADAGGFLKALGPWQCIRAALGLAFLFEEPRPKAGTAFVDHIAVDAAFRGRGLGWWLLERAELWARIEGLREMVLDVSEANPARRLYERFGFRERRVSRSRLTERFFGIRNWVVMVKILEAQRLPVRGST